MKNKKQYFDFLIIFNISLMNTKYIFNDKRLKKIQDADAVIFCIINVTNKLLLSLKCYIGQYMFMFFFC